MKNNYCIILAILFLGGCGGKNDATVLVMKKLPSYDACVSEAKAYVANRTDIKSVTEEHKQDGNVGLYMAEIKLTSGGTLRQLCEISRHDMTATYSVVGAGPGVKPGLPIKPGLQIPGGFTLLETKEFSALNECDTSAKAEIAQRADVRATSPKKTDGVYTNMVELNNGGTLVQLCHVVSIGKTMYYMMGKLK